MTLRRTGFKPPTPEKLKEAQERKYAKAVAKSKASIGLERHRMPQKPRKAMKRVGKHGEANRASRSLIAEIAEQHQMTTCEIQLPNCMRTWPLAPAHRHKRAWYKANVQKLADIKQWITACQVCHDQIEHNATLTEEIFLKLRGAE